MARQKKQQEAAWAICISHPDGTIGWLVGEDLDVKTYPSKEDAEKSLKQMKRGSHYSWHHPIEIKEFTGF